MVSLNYIFIHKEKIIDVFYDTNILSREFFYVIEYEHSIFL